MLFGISKIVFTQLRGHYLDHEIFSKILLRPKIGSHRSRVKFLRERVTVEYCQTWILCTPTNRSLIRSHTGFRSRSIDNNRNSTSVLSFVSIFANGFQKYTHKTPNGRGAMRTVKTNGGTLLSFSETPIGDLLTIFVSTSIRAPPPRSGPANTRPTRTCGPRGLCGVAIRIKRALSGPSPLRRRRPLTDN